MSCAAPRIASRTDAAAIHDIIDRAEARGLDDALRADIDQPSRDSAGFLLSRGYAHVMPAPSSTAKRPAWLAGYVAASDDAALLLDAIVEHVGSLGGGTITMWRAAADETDARTAASAGFRAAREQQQLRSALPLTIDPPLSKVSAASLLPVGVAARTFDLARDATPWLDLNNRAFSGHPEQGNWSLHTLEQRLREPWFDATLFVLAADDMGLIGFNWLKPHAAAGADPAMIEIYVIGVDPRFHGRGVGRALAILGLERARERGFVLAMLHVASDNHAALRLYEALGFTIHHVDRAFEREVPPR